MVSDAFGALRVLEWRRWLELRWSTPVLLTALTAISLLLRTRILNAGFWIDEGLSVGIAHHHWTSIPHVLKEDGSPPAYYMLLGLWIRVFGDGERATHTLSLIFALACIPLAYAVAKSLFGRTTAIVVALLATFDPYLTYYAQETRMYTMEAFLSLLVAWAYVNGVLRGSWRWCAALVLSLTLLLYTHNWALFVCAALAATTAIVARERWREFAGVAIGVAILYAPWLPTLLYQVRHTGAPWSTSPNIHELVLAPGAVLQGDGPLMAFALVGGIGLAAHIRRRDDAERTVLLGLLWSVAITVLLAWVASQVSPAWTTRYFAVVVGALLLVAARGLVEARRLGLIALVLVLFVWMGYSAHNDKENARQLAAALTTHPGELLISTHPEQIPVLRYYFGPTLRYANTFGPVKDPQVFNWADAVSRLRATPAQPTLNSLIATVPKGQDFIVITPVFRDYRAWDAKWTKLVWQTSTVWSSLLQHDSQVQEVGHVATNEIALHLNYFKPLQAFVYRRLG
ncbi:MAG TPA: glycosyltransferase family 39 protein [Gaiellaceae bacterium]|nr:glycosyltransferase family 39 protein [Gaiellaceae bacterium]